MVQKEDIMVSSVVISKTNDSLKLIIYPEGIGGNLGSSVKLISFIS